MLIYYLIFILILFFAVTQEKYTVKTRKQFFWSFACVLILFAGFRGQNVDRDYSGYKSYFDNVASIEFLFTNSDYFFSSVQRSLEPSITIIMSFVKTIFSHGFPLVILIYAILSVSLKMVAIKRMSDYFLYSLLIYFAGAFLLQDMTQIRIAVASGFLLLSIPHIVDRNIKKFSLFLFLAILFHYSAIIFIPFYFFNTKKINQGLYISLILASILLAAIKFNPIEILLNSNIEFIVQNIKAQIAARTQFQKVNIFNVIMLFHVFMCITFILLNKKIDNKYTTILTKIYSFSVIFFYLFSFHPIMAFRTSEVLNIVQIILIPQLISVVKPKFLGEILVVVISILYLLNQLLVNPILEPYSFFFTK